MPLTTFAKTVITALLSICSVVILAEAGLAQLCDLRHSLQPLPGVSEITEVGIFVNMGSAQALMQPTAIIKTLQPRLETLGYRVAQTATHSPDGLWLHVDGQDLPEKIAFPSRNVSPPLSNKVLRLGPPYIPIFKIIGRRWVGASVKLNRVAMETIFENA